MFVFYDWPFPYIKARKLRYFGHVVRKSGDCSEKEIIQGRAGRRRKGRPKTSRIRNITSWTGLKRDRLMRQVDERLQWRQTVHSAANTRTILLRRMTLVEWTAVTRDSLSFICRSTLASLVQWSRAVRTRWACRRTSTCVRALTPGSDCVPRRECSALPHTHTQTRAIITRNDTTEAVNTHAVTELESAVADKLANGRRARIADGLHC